MKEKKLVLVPRRRFAEFSNGWKLNKLDDLGQFGKTYAYSRAKEGNGEYHHIHYGDIHVKYNGFITENTLIPSLSVQGDFEVLKENDIVIADASEDYFDLGKTAIVQAIDNKKIIAGLHTFKITPNENLNSKFYLYYSQTNLFKNFSYKTGTGISVFGISKANIRKMQLNIPKQKEQQIIGDFFKQLDQMITLEQRKLEKTKALKSAYLADMFPAEGERVPKRRFAGFTGEWKERRLEDLAEVRTGKAFSSLDFNDEGEYLVITNKNVQDQENDVTLVGDRIDIKDESIINDYLLNGINVLVTMDGVNIGKTGKFKHEKAVLAQRVGRLNSDQVEFIYQITKMNKFILEMKRLSVGNAIKHISLKQIAEYSFFAPVLKEEQRAIGEFFKKLDDSITNQQQKLDKLKAMKQAYLQEMFV